MKRVLITGADGFTGRYLARQMSLSGYEVHGLVRHSVAEPIAGISAIHIADLTDVAGMLAVVEAVRPQKVAHLAAIAFVGHGDVDAIYRTNVVGTRNLLEALVQRKAPVDAVLLASSANIYGNSVCGVLEESTPAAPANDYAVSKLAMEYVARLYTERLPVVIARPFNYTGVGQAESFLIPKIINHVLRRATVIELGNLEVAREFSDVRTVVACYQRLLDADAIAVVGKTFNVCTGQTWTMNEVLALVRDISGHPFEVRINPMFVRQNEVIFLAGSNAKFNEAVGFVPQIALTDTLRWMLLG